MSLKRTRAAPKNTRPTKRIQQAGVANVVAVKAKPALRRQQTAIQMLNAKEKKYNDLTLNTDASTTSTEVALSTFATGDTALLRDGNKAIFKSIHVKIRFTNKALTQSNVVRVVIWVDLLAQAEQAIWGTGAAVQDVFDAATVVARRNILSAERFIILMDEVVVINETSGTGGAPNMVYLERYVKVPLMYQLVAWSGASATIPVRNAFTLAYLGSTAAGTTAVTTEGTVRVRFTDK